MTNLATHQSPPATISMGDEFRRIAGLPAVPSTSSGTPAVQPTQTHAPEPERSTVNPTPQASPAPATTPNAEIVDEKDEDPTDNAEEKPAYPEAVMKAAKDAEGLTGEELVAVVQSLYDKAVKDGKASCKTKEEPTPEEEE
jgi:hypothetical protein